MCRFCDQIGPICPWRAKKSLEAYFADWPCSDCEPETCDTTSELEKSCLLGQSATDGCPGERPPQSPTEAVPVTPPARLVVLRPGTVIPIHASPDNPPSWSFHRADRRAHSLCAQVSRPVSVHPGRRRNDGLRGRASRPMMPSSSTWPSRSTTRPPPSRTSTRMSPPCSRSCLLRPRS
jgi:hypothetical protein